MPKICGVCGEGVLSSLVERREVEFEGNFGVVPCHYSFCSACGCEQVDATQLRLNRDLMKDFKEGITNDKV